MKVCWIIEKMKSKVVKECIKASAVKGSNINKIRNSILKYAKILGNNAEWKIDEENKVIKVKNYTRWINSWVLIEIYFKEIKMAERISK